MGIVIHFCTFYIEVPCGFETFGQIRIEGQRRKSRDRFDGLFQITLYLQINIKHPYLLEKIENWPVIKWNINFGFEKKWIIENFNYLGAVI